MPALPFSFLWIGWAREWGHICTHASTVKEYGKRKLLTEEFQGPCRSLEQNVFQNHQHSARSRSCFLPLTNISLIFPQINVTTVREYLPEGDFSIMTEMLKKFLSFMNLTVSNFYCNFCGFKYKYDTLMTVEIKILWP